MALKKHGWYYFDTSGNLASDNDTFPAGRIIVESNTLKVKVADGSTAYNSLTYFADIADHQAAVDPHTGYRLESAAITAADISNRTRSLFIDMKACDTSTGFSAQLGAQPDEIHTLRLDDAADASIFTNFQVPQDWASGALTLRAHLSMASTSATPDVRMSAGYLEIDAGNPIGARTVVGPSTVTLTSTTNVQTTDFTLGTPSAAGKHWGIYLRRFGANAADTYAQNMRVLGFEIRYTADS